MSIGQEMLFLYLYIYFIFLYRAYFIIHQLIHKLCIIITWSNSILNKTLSDATLMTVIWELWRNKNVPCIKWHFLHLNAWDYFMGGAIVCDIPLLSAGEHVIGLPVWGDCGPLKTLMSSGTFWHEFKTPLSMSGVRGWEELGWEWDVLAILLRIPMIVS